MQGSGRLLRDKDKFQERDLAYLRTLYDASIAYTDHELGRLFDYLKANGLEDALLIITSDHGEEFNEHGHFGHRELFRESLQIPLIIRLPKNGRAEASGLRVSTPVGLIDLYRTLLEETGAGTSTNSKGRNLLAELRAGPLSGSPVFSETTDHFYEHATDQISRQSIRYNNHSLIRHREGDAVEDFLYDFTLDGSADKLLTGRVATDLAATLGQRITDHLSEQELLRRGVLGDVEPEEATVLDDETRRELEALGYTGD